MKTFISENLNCPDQENFDIERVHRLRSADSEKAIIVKFSKYKDREMVLSRAKSRLRHTEYTVQDDFTYRVKLHRRELGKRLIEERARGNHAAISYDKVVIERSVWV